MSPPGMTDARCDRFFAHETFRPFRECPKATGQRLLYAARATASGCNQYKNRLQSLKSNTRRSASPPDNRGVNRCRSCSWSG